MTQVVHDVCIQNLPVRFILDRAGLVGADGSTHAGAFDTAYLGCLPNMMLMAPSDESELSRMVDDRPAQYDEGPCALRFPRGNGYGVKIDANAPAIEVGKGSALFAKARNIAILSFGGRLQECLEAADILKTKKYQFNNRGCAFRKTIRRKPYP